MEKITTKTRTDRIVLLMKKNILPTLEKELENNIDFKNATTGAMDATLILQNYCSSNKEKETIEKISERINKVKIESYWFGFELTMDSFDAISIYNKAKTKYALDDLLKNI